MRRDEAEVRSEAVQGMLDFEFETSELEFFQDAIGRPWRFMKQGVTGFPSLCKHRKKILMTGDWLSMF